MSLPSSSSIFFFFFFLILLFNPHLTSSQQQHQKKISSFSSSNPPWTPSQHQILISPNSTFAAGFLPSKNSPNRFVFSVWYYNLSPTTAVWSANDKDPIDSSGKLFITSAGELNLTNSSGFGSGPEPKAKLVLHDNGTLVFGKWESFSHPTDTILPLQQINGTTLISKNGKFKFLYANQLVFNEKNDSYWSIPNNGLQMLDEQGLIHQFSGDIFYCSDYGPENLRRLVLENDGNLRVYSFDRISGNWTSVWQAVYQLCHIHGTCGDNSICMYDAATTKTSCLCPPGFKKTGESCERKVPMADMKKTKFLPLDFVNFTGGANQTDLKADNFTVCQAQCLAKKNCLGFMMKYDGTGYCVLQLDTLAYGFWSPGSETVTFLRVDSSERDVSNYTGMTNLMETSCPVRISLPPPPPESKATARNIAIISTLFAAELISGVFFFWAFLKKYIKYRDMARTFGLEIMPAVGPKRFSFNELKDATKNFADKIGRGGYGDVYRGKLSDGRSVAVKCLKNVAGGDSEFWAEVTIIARMHHLNLVRLWGFCAEKGKRILVYEYVPNGSLDKFLFQPILVGGSSDTNESAESEPVNPNPEQEPKPILDWNIRYRIALGVARAIAYLHEECLEWVLHCDIKPENILLGDDFCPKVSDFGLAKLKKKEEIMTMSRFRGTPGYIAPEWTRADPITPKADVYSFGLVLLEIVCGVRNFDQCTSRVESDLWFLPSWAFDKVYKEMNVEDILDPRIKHSYDTRAHFDMVNRMVKTAMWCLQDRADQRPSMGKVAKMLEGTVEIIEPKRPSIFYLPPEEQ